MAKKRKKKKKRRWFKLLLLFLLTPLIIWSLAFGVWIYWPELEKNIKFWERGKTPLHQTQKASHERILKEERRQLDEILRER
ncbi:MAG: hypothetical protein ACE5HC_02190 [Candidatus Binatia bacterium]